MEQQAAQRLPSLPQLLHRILGAVHDDHLNLQGMAEIVGQDPAIAVRLIDAANSTYFNGASGRACQTLERALLVLGLEAVKTLVITAAIKQFVGSLGTSQRRFMRAYWQRSLTAANFSQVLASLTRYRAPAEAYLCGLLHQIGQLLLLDRHGEAWLALWEEAGSAEDLAELERSHFGTDHCSLGAELLDQWLGGGFMADAIRFQAEPAPAVRDANHLVKIVNTASALSAAAPNDAGYRRASELFGLSATLTQELAERITADVDRLAQSLQIEIGEREDDATARRALAEQLGNLGQLGQCSIDLWRSRSLELLDQAVGRSLRATLGLRQCVLFTVTPDRAMLRGSLQHSEARPRAPTDEADFVVPIEPGRSVVSETLRQRAMLVIDGSAAAVLDRQLLRQCRAQRLHCLPLLAQDEPVGVLVVAGLASEEQPPDNPLVAALCREIAAVVRHHLDDLGAGQLVAANGSEAWRTKIEEAVHEAGNPLSIIRNYLEMLRARLGDDHAAHGELGLIRDEIDRVGDILLRLREVPTSETGRETALDPLLDDTAHLFQQSLFAARSIALKRDAGAPDQAVAEPAHLKQIVINLLKNAAEALPEGGVIELVSESPVMVNGKPRTAITIRDNGPGIPPSVMERLFQPVTSAKGGTHAGLGLSIVKRLVDELGGTIACRSRPGGTSFELLLPSQPRTVGDAAA